MNRNEDRSLNDAYASLNNACASQKAYEQRPPIAMGGSLVDKQVVNASCEQAASGPRPARVGEIVMVDIGREENGTRVHPAVVVRVWSATCINVRVFLDSNDGLWKTSLCHKSSVAPPSRFEQARPTYWYREYEGGPLE